MALDEIIEVNNLYQLIDEPTNIRRDSMSCIDLIITDQPHLFIESGVHPSLDNNCQHQIIYGKLNISLPNAPPYKRTVWEYEKANIPSVRAAISALNWELIFQGLQVDDMAEVFSNKIFEILSSDIPNRTIKCDDRDPPWITSQLKTAIKRKHRVYRRYIERGKNNDDWCQVKTIRNETSRMIVNAKNKYYHNLGRKLSDPNMGPKKYWSTLTRLINNKNTCNIPPLLENGLFITNPANKASVFNEYFVQQCSTIQNTSSLPTFQPITNNQLNDIAVNKDKILKLIRMLDTKKAHGCDGISVSMIKICDSSIVDPLCMIFERSLATGLYPSLWKKANIIPIHKKDSRQTKKNYRPISLLPIFGKIFEKLLFDDMYEHLNANGLLSENQSGFRPGDSTVNQLLAITHKIHSGFDQTPSRETRAVFLDLSKAFDRVWHAGLLYKLESNGISGNLLKLMRSFLSHRQQRVILNGQQSEWQEVSAGVPQGSVLGPLFFLIYINDLTDNLKCDVKLFADDTSLFTVVENESISAQNMNSDLEKISLWAWQWKMQFNADKTEELLFSVKRQRPLHPPLRLENEEITSKTEHKHLGMILDSKLSFKSHVNEAILKAKRGIGLIRHLSQYVSRDVLDQMYKLYVRPHLDYGDIVYHKYDPDLSSVITKRLEQTQYAASLAVTGAWRGTSRQKLYDELGWESLYERRWYRRLCHFFKLKVTQYPVYLFSLIPPQRQISYDLRNPQAYAQNRARTDRFSNSYFYNTLHEWNKLPTEICSSKSLAEFKRKLIALIRPVKKTTYGVTDLKGIRNITKLRVKFSDLNAHKFRHNFECLRPICNCNTANEDNEHYLLHCPHFDTLRGDLFGTVTEVLGIDIADLDSETLCNLLLYGSSNLNIIENRIIIEATIEFIEKTHRLH